MQAYHSSSFIVNHIPQPQHRGTAQICLVDAREHQGVSTVQLQCGKTAAVRSTSDRDISSHASLQSAIGGEGLLGNALRSRKDAPFGDCSATWQNPRILKKTFKIQEAVTHPYMTETCSGKVPQLMHGLGSIMQPICCRQDRTHDK